MNNTSPTNRLISRLTRFLPPILFGLAFALYAATAAPGVLFGDPSEYQFVPAVLTIAHPPGYAFYTLLAKLWQTVVAVGSIAYRTNLLAAAMGAWVVTAVYLTVRQVGWQVERRQAIQEGRATSAHPHTLGALFAALCVAVSPDLWQHAIHANAHVVSVALTTTHLLLLVRWWRTGQDGWLMGCAVLVGLSVTHHPITLMAAPAYVLFILAVRPRIWRQWRLLLILAGCGLLGLLPWLYYPLRSPHLPAGFQPRDMNTWDGFWRHVTARGLRVNFFQFGLVDQADRALVFWSLLRLQFPILVIALAVLGLIVLVRRVPAFVILASAFILLHLAFTMNFYQDTMAYLLNPFAALSVVAGLGAQLFIAAVDRAQLPIKHWSVAARRWLLVGFLFAWPVYQGVMNLRRGISLRDFTAAQDYVDAVYDRFAGRGEGVVLLTDWERLTPLLVHIHAEGKPLDEADVKKVVFVNSADGPTWVQHVWQNADLGPLYVVGYRPALRDEGLRLVPDGPFYRVMLPSAFDGAPDQPLDVWADDRVHVVGYDLPQTTVRAGEPLHLALYQRVEQPLGEGTYWMPYAQLGPVEARWTTDSRLNTPRWEAGEVVVQAYELPVPFNLESGAYPLRLGYADLSGGRPELTLSTGETTLQLATVTVQPNPSPPATEVLAQALANLDNQIALMDARARVGLQVRQGRWEEPVVAGPGQALHLTLTWRALASPRDVHTYNVFVHLIDGANQAIAGQDAPPLGGAFPTTLWFPKWLPGQMVQDPYRVVIPAGTPPGQYQVEVGMYGMTSLRRLPVVDLGGNLAGDRIILGPVRVE